MLTFSLRSTSIKLADQKAVLSFNKSRVKPLDISAYSNKKKKKIVEEK